MIGAIFILFCFRNYSCSNFSCSNTHHSCANRIFSIIYYRGGQAHPPHPRFLNYRSVAREPHAAREPQFGQLWSIISRNVLSEVLVLFFLFLFSSSSCASDIHLFDDLIFHLLATTLVAFCSNFYIEFLLTTKNRKRKKNSMILERLDWTFNSACLNIVDDDNRKKEYIWY